jgi:hypothetical protein
VDIVFTKLSAVPRETEAVKLIQWRELFFCGVSTPTLNAGPSIAAHHVGAFIDVLTAVWASGSVHTETGKLAGCVLFNTCATVGTRRGVTGIE